MSERRVVITQENGEYKIHNTALNSFELLGLFEQIIFDLKYSRRAEKSSKEDDQETDQKAERSAESFSTAVEPILSAMPTAPAAAEENAQTKTAASERITGVSGTLATDLRTRIGNAVKAIRDLGGRVESNDLTKMTDNELHTELEELTAQYKRLKNSKGK